MKIAANIVGVLLGLLFIFFSLLVLLHMAPEPKLPAGSPAAMFMGAFGPTGYMTFVKICELAGGVLVAIPAIRNAGLLILGPVIINILAFHVFIEKGADIAIPAVLALMALFLVWSERKAFEGLIRK